MTDLEGAQTAAGKVHPLLKGGQLVQSSRATPPRDKDVWCTAARSIKLDAW